ncbi:hypothetical protein ACQL2C_002998 [Yersinia enterocolitica]
MTDEIKTGGPAFPIADMDFQTFKPSTVDEHKRLLSGMSLHDYFSAKAMAALIHRYADVNIDAPGVMEEIAIRARKMASAMIKARG